MQQPRIQVYIIDDEPSIRTAYARLIRANGMQAGVFHSVEEFMAADFAASEACVVADVQLPGRSGLDLPGLLKVAGHELPVIFVSAQPPELIGHAVTQPGVVGFFSKPVDGQELVDLITRVVRREIGR